jgi:ABC-type multidrug transport system fused ATPase/permease subunit
MSSMDSLSEEKIIANLKTLPIPVIICVSHRFSTIADSDLVYFLKDPRTIITDTPRTLLKKEEAFYNLFAAQIKERSAERKIRVI